MLVAKKSFSKQKNIEKEKQTNKQKERQHLRTISSVTPAGTHLRINFEYPLIYSKDKLSPPRPHDLPNVVALCDNGTAAGPFFQPLSHRILPWYRSYGFIAEGNGGLAGGQNGCLSTNAVTLALSLSISLSQRFLLFLKVLTVVWGPLNRKSRSHIELNKSHLHLLSLIMR